MGGIFREEGMGWEEKRVKILRDKDGRDFEEGGNGVGGEKG